MKRVLISTGYKEYGYTNLAHVLASFTDIQVVLFTGFILPKALVKSKTFLFLKKNTFLKSMNFRAVQDDDIQCFSNSLLEIINWFSLKYGLKKLENWTRWRYKWKLNILLDKGFDYVVLRPGFCPKGSIQSNAYLLLSIAYPDFIVNELKDFGQSSAAFTSEYWQEIKDDLIECSNIIINSRHIAETFPLELRNKNFLLLYNPVDVRVHQLNHDRRKRDSFCFVGEIGYRKGFDRIIEVFNNFGCENLTFHIVGAVSSDIHRDFFEFLQLHGGKNNLIYLPSCEKGELVNIYRESEFFLFPTRAEGSSRAVIEAMIEGCIPITTRFCGVELSDGENAIIYDRWDGDFISDSLDKTLRDHDSLRSKVGEIELVYSRETYNKQIREIADGFV